MKVVAISEPFLKRDVGTTDKGERIVIKLAVQGTQGLVNLGFNIWVKNSTPVQTSNDILF
jgi:hypothetical protein